LVITAAAAFAVNAFVNRHIVQTMEPESMAVYNIAAGSLGFVVVSIAEGEVGMARPRRAERRCVADPCGYRPADRRFRSGVLPAARHVPVWKLRTWMLIVPLLVAGADWLVWGTRLTGWQWLGTALLLGGLAALIHLERRDRINGPP
jgi:drug/metabolite transporter (DMT)-like permease